MNLVQRSGNRFVFVYLEYGGSLTGWAIVQSCFVPVFRETDGLVWALWFVTSESYVSLYSRGHFGTFLCYNTTYDVTES